MKGHKFENVLVMVGTNAPGKPGLCHWLWGLWEIPGEPLGEN